MSAPAHIIASEADWAAFWPVVQERLNGRKIIALEGELGAGKTTFVKTIATALQAEDQVSSPSFSIVQEYLLRNGDTLYHFDLYRLKSIEELFDLDFERYLDSGDWVIIEWPQLAEAFLPENRALWLRIEHLAQPGRAVVFL